MDLSSLSLLNLSAAAEVKASTIVTVAVCGHLELYDTTSNLYQDGPKKGDRRKVSKKVGLPGRC